MAEDHPLVCRFGALGDMVLITPLLRQLYQRSGLPCDVVAIGGWNQKLFAEMPWVRRVYSIDSRSAPYWFNRSQRELVKNLRAQDHRFTWICETSRKSYRLLERAGITRANSINELDLEPVNGEHYCDKWLRLGNLSPPGFDHAALTEPARATELFVADDEIDECRRWLEIRGIDAEAPLICVQAGNKRTTRRGRADRASNSKYWHERNWAEVTDRIIEQQPGSQLLLCGVPNESEMCEAIRSHSRHPQSVHNLADDLPMRRLLALMTLAHSCVSVDTGPAHIAAALNCPLVVLFGKARPGRFQPVAAHSPVAVLQGFDGASGGGEPDIGFITVEQVMTAWQNAVRSA